MEELKGYVLTIRGVSLSKREREELTSKFKEVFKVPVVVLSVDEKSSVDLMAIYGRKLGE